MPTKTLAVALALVSAAPAAMWLDVPFVKQGKNGCGPASISMVLAYWRSGEIETRRHLGEKMFASEMERSFHTAGFRTFAFQGEWSDLEQHLAKGRPLIVGLGKSRHYVVVAGVDSDRELVSINDPARRKLLQLDRKTFEQDWKASGSWTLLALPPPKQ
jgi:ABC-type bacteriocin/lantibiotic exporter with double-glycine peptidase domain